MTGDPADASGRPVDIVAACNAAIPGNQRNAVARAAPDLVVALSTWEAGERVVDGVWHPFGSPEADATLRRLYSETIDRLAAGGARVALVTVPDTVDSAARPANADTNRRYDLLNPLLERVVAENAGRSTLLRLDDIVCPTTPCPTQVDGVVLRPADGAHFDAAPGARLVAERLAERIAAIDLRPR